MKECNSLPYHSQLSLLSYTMQHHLPRDDTTYNGPGPPPSINQENVPKKLVYKASLMGASSQLSSLLHTPNLSQTGGSGEL